MSDSSSSSNGSSKSSSLTDCTCDAISDTVYCRITFIEADPESSAPATRENSVDIELTSPRTVNPTLCAFVDWGGSYERYFWNLKYGTEPPEAYLVTFYVGFACGPDLSIGWAEVGFGGAFMSDTVGSIDCPPFPSYYEFDGGSFGFSELTVRLQWEPFV